MAIIVQKFGGTSVADIEHIKQAALKVVTAQRQGFQPIVVVSAMAGVTNQLVAYASSVATLDNKSKLAEYDVALSSGEIVTAALMALAIQELSSAAESMLGWQAGIVTTNQHNKATIAAMDSSILQQKLANNIIPVIAGFQGVTEAGRVTTLGRGGSDTTAAAVAACLTAEFCDIYTDVSGVYAADPRLIASARRLSVLSYEEMVAFASMGAKVLHPRSVEIAMRYNIPLRVISSFHNNQPTIITNKVAAMEHPLVTGVTYNKNIVTLMVKLKGQIASLTVLNNLLAQDVHLLQTNQCNENLVIVIAFEDLLIAKRALQAMAVEYSASTDIAIIAVIGFGMQNLMPQIMQLMQQNQVPIQALQVSGIKLEMIVKEDMAEGIVKLLYKALVENA